VHLTLDAFILNEKYLAISMNARDLFYIVNAYPVMRRGCYLE
jgi:hypothetical protein